MAELRREGTRRTIGLEGLLPRALYRYRIEVDDVVDLADDTTGDLVANRWTLTQQIGVTAYDQGCAGLLVPSATGIDAVLVVFLDNVGSGLVEPSLAELWESSADL